MSCPDIVPSIGQYFPLYANADSALFDYNAQELQQPIMFSILSPC